MTIVDCERDKDLRDSKRRGFTLIELMIVAAVIAIIAAIAIPLMLRQRIAANETSAIAALRTISTAQSSYREAVLRDDNADGDGDFGTLTELSTTAVPGAQTYIDSSLGSGVKSGYLFSIDVFPGTDADPIPRYSAFAFPGAYNQTGTRNFYVDQENILRFTQGQAEAGSLGPTSPPIQ